MIRPRIAGLALLLLVSGLSGCLDASDRFYDFDPDEHYRNPGVFPGDYRMGRGGSLALERGNLTELEPYMVRLVSDLDAYGELTPLMEAAGYSAQVNITMAIWRPNTTEPVPIIVDAGPYFEFDCLAGLPDGTCLQQATILDPQQTTPFSLSNFLPRGYAVVQLAIRGTGTSGGCMDLTGPSEQHDLDQALTWLGEQPWSNGRIGMTGVSYDGSTPWVAAATGNPYLKTIVPISGLPDFYDLMFHNGSAETRGQNMHNQVYWGFGFSDEFPRQPDEWPDEAPWVGPAGNGLANGREDYQDMQNLVCPEVVEGSALAVNAAYNGDRGSAYSTYWTERDHRQAVIDNYEGSIFLIHGLQDWNVDPHTAIPFNQELREAGFEMKEWYGQWGHARPDSMCAPNPPQWVVLPCRLDYGDVLRRWYDHYLMLNTTAELGPEIQVQDNLGFWRNADSYPPQGLEWSVLHMNADGSLGDEPGAAGDVMLPPPGNGGPGDLVVLESEPLEEELHLSGLPQIRLPFTPQGEGGHIAAWLFDQDPDGRVRAPMAGEIFAFEDPNKTRWAPLGVPVIGHAQMNLRFYAGGEEPQPLVAGQRHLARIEFEPLEVRVPAGHRLVLWLFQYHYPEHQDSATPAPVTLHLDEEALFRMPAIDVDPRTVFPVPGANFLNHTYVREMYVPMPALPPALQVNVPDTVPMLAGAPARDDVTSSPGRLPQEDAVGIDGCLGCLA